MRISAKYFGLAVRP